MSAGKHKSKIGGRQKPLSEREQIERYMFKLSRQVGLACDEWQLRKNGYVSGGMRGVMQSSILEHQKKKAS
jgi:hypothetical protein